MNESLLAPKVSVIMPLKDGGVYLPFCLASLKRQTYTNYELIIYDNASKDRGLEIIRKELPQAQIIPSEKNYYVGGAVNRALPHATGKYILVLCVDVILDENFLKNAVAVCEIDQKIGALQAKILKFNLINNSPEKTDIVDTTGFSIYKSGRIVNRGHGEKDAGQYQTGEVFSFEGAAGFFNKEALEDAKVNGELFDEDFKWMAEDIDLGWRLRNLGWKNYYSADVICWHDRKTTKRLSTGRLDFIRQRREILPLKRKLDFRNTVLTFVKNLFWGNILRHFPSFALRKVQLVLYITVFEPSSYGALWGIIKNLPKMLKKRRNIMKRKKINSKEIEKWLN